MAWIRTQDGKAVWDVIGAEIEHVTNYSADLAQIRVYGRVGAASEDGIIAYEGPVEETEIILSHFRYWLDWRGREWRHWAQTFDFGNVVIIPALPPRPPRGEIVERPDPHILFDTPDKKCHRQSQRVAELERGGS